MHSPAKSLRNSLKFAKGTPSRCLLIIALESWLVQLWARAPTIPYCLHNYGAKGSCLILSIEAFRAHACSFWRFQGPYHLYS